MKTRGDAVIVVPKGTKREYQQTICRCGIKLTDLGYYCGDVLDCNKLVDDGGEALKTYCRKVLGRNAVLLFPKGWERDPFCQKIEQLAKEDKVKRLYEI